MGLRTALLVKFRGCNLSFGFTGMSGRKLRLKRIPKLMQDLLDALPNEFSFVILSYLMGLRDQRQTVTVHGESPDPLFAALPRIQRVLDVVRNCRC